MIVGIGVDSIEIARVARAIRGNSRLMERLYTAGEIQEFPPRPAPRMAVLFAAKEAAFKALGTGLAGHSWQQVEILHKPGGAPYICLHGRARDTAKSQGISALHISLSHDQERAVAFCIAEGEV